MRYGGLDDFTIGGLILQRNCGIIMERLCNLCGRVQYIQFVDFLLQTLIFSLFQIYFAFLSRNTLSRGVVSPARGPPTSTLNPKFHCRGQLSLLITPLDVILIQVRFLA